MRDRAEEVSARTITYEHTPLDLMVSKQLNMGELTHLHAFKLAHLHVIPPTRHGHLRAHPPHPLILTANGRMCLSWKGECG